MSEPDNHNKPEGQDTDAEEKSSQLYDAMYSGDLALAQELIDAGADVDYEYGRSRGLSETCLLAAIRNENPEMVELLLARGADPDKTDNSGASPLFNAMSTDDLDRSSPVALEIIQCLVEHGANVKWQTGMVGKTPLMDAIAKIKDSTIRDSVIELLLDHGADPYVKGRNGERFFALAERWKVPLSPRLVAISQETVLQRAARSLAKRFPCLRK